MQEWLDITLISTVRFIAAYSRQDITPESNGETNHEATELKWNWKNCQWTSTVADLPIIPIFVHLIPWAPRNTKEYPMVAPTMLWVVDTGSFKTVANINQLPHPKWKSTCYLLTNHCQIFTAESGHLTNHEIFFGLVVQTDIHHSFSHGISDFVTLKRPVMCISRDRGTFDLTQ